MQRWCRCRKTVSFKMECAFGESFDPRAKSNMIFWLLDCKLKLESLKQRTLANFNRSLASFR